LAKIVTFNETIGTSFGVPWYTATYSPHVGGTLELLMTAPDASQTVVGIECNDHVPVERGLELGLYASMIRMSRQKPCHAMLILTNAAQLVQINIKLPPLCADVPIDFELLYRTAYRKCQLPGPVAASSLMRDYQFVTRSKK
jgi:hypothetical protein